MRPFTLGIGVMHVESEPWAAAAGDPLELVNGSTELKMRIGSIRWADNHLPVMAQRAKNVMRESELGLAAEIQRVSAQTAKTASQTDTCNERHYGCGNNKNQNNCRSDRW